MSQSPTQSFIGPSKDGYVEAWRQVNSLLRDGRSFSGRERNCCFLNLGSQPFTDVSSVSGFDFDDDGRSLALTDWDLDGDLDLWTTNRNGPRVRFFENSFSNQPNFLGLKLVGTSADCNRDAIGARVEVQLGDKRSATLIRTVRSGDGYLSQSSRRVLFGLGDAKSIGRLRVRWPNGQVEEFSLPAVNAHYQLRQGTGKCQPIVAGAIKLKPTDSIAPSPSMQMQTANLLTQRLALPPLSYETFGGEQNDASRATTSRPLLLNLWSTSCRACVSELVEWSSRHDDLEPNVDVVLLAVDGIQANGSTSADDVQQQLAQLQVPFASGMASNELFQKIQIVHNHVYDHSRPLPVPTSLLIDAEGRLAAIYKGAVSVDRILTDCSRLDLDDDALLAAALPATGQWIATPGPHAFRQIVNSLFAAGLSEDAVAFSARLDNNSPTRRHQADAIVRQAVESARQGDPTTAITRLREALELDPKSARAHMELGTIYGRRNELSLAIQHLKQAIELDGDNLPDAYLNLGVALRYSGNGEEAVKMLLRALEIDPTLTPAHVNLALLKGQQGDVKTAAAHFRAALQIDPSRVQTRINLAVALIQTQRPEEALKELRTTLEQEPDLPIALSYTSDLLVELGRIDECIDLLQQAVERRPQVAPLRLRLAGNLEQAGRPAKAIEQYREAERLERGNLQALSRLAWILSTDPDPSLRDGKQAIRYARRASDKSDGKNVAVLDVLAAAFAEAGDFEQAVKTAELAEKTALENNRPQDAEAVARRLTLYRQSKPYRTPER